MDLLHKKSIEIWNQELQSYKAEEIINWSFSKFSQQIVMSTSMGVEDQIITHIIYKQKLLIPHITLDTGRLFPETYNVLAENQKKYPMKFHVYFPNPEKVESMVNTHGVNLFYDSIEKRKLCCSIRKSEPLARALSPYSAWICGLRQEQSASRKNINPIEWDHLHEKVKINPLWNWSEQQVWNYAHQNEVIYNPLHQQGYPSIGCASCTRALKPNEDIRAGRWWWENEEHKECGLHNRRPIQ